MWDRISSSLFYVPFLFSLGAVVLGQGMLFVDEAVDDIPDRLTATVDSARSVLGVIAGATLTFAAIAFSVSLLLISAASSQYSPRVVHGLFRDPFNKRVMGVVVGTFIYCLVVMRAVRGPLEDAGTPVVPSLSVLAAVVLGLVAILSIIAFINHSAHALEVSTLLHNVTEDALARVRQSTPDREEDDADGWLAPAGDGLAVRFETQGWVQSIDHDDLLAAAPAGGSVALDTIAGRYALRSAPICHIWPVPEDSETTTRKVRSAITVGPSRNMLQDVTYGVRQLADVTLKALSPGINDPTTAQDAMFHLASVVRELLARPTPGRRRTDERGTTLVMFEQPTPDDIVTLAFDEIRIASVGQPTVLIYLLEILHALEQTLRDTARTDVASLRNQADLVLDVAELGDLPEPDRERIRQAHANRFAGT